MQILNYEPKKKEKASNDLGIFGNPFPNLKLGNKEEFFDNFLVDLFSNNLDLSKMGMQN